jgi:membrane-bound lytic murein transglycosylase B
VNRSRAVALLFTVLAALALFSTSQRRPLSPTAAAVPIADQTPPAPNARVPGNGADLARSLAGADKSLRAALHSEAGGGSVTLYALYMQRALRRLARHPRLLRTTTAHMAPKLARQTRDIVAALRDLSALSAHWKPHRIVVGRAEPLSALRGYYREAQRRFRVGWPVLAAVNHVESAFGRLRNASVSGAQGPMQFMPSTWRAYGLGGNVRDPRDAILGAANYLHANGAPGSYAAALYHYNPSPRYVDAVLRYARLMARDPDALPSLYAWQVFVRTGGGERRVTGP